jgi:hypothetical protein
VPDGPRPAGPPALPPRGGPHNDGAEEDTEVVVTVARWRRRAHSQPRAGTAHDLPLDGHGDPRERADAAVALGAEGRPARPVVPAAHRMTRSEVGIDLYWLPLGAGGWFVRLNGRIYEAVTALAERRRPLDLYHSALEVRVPEGRFVIENCWPIPDGDRAGRGVAVDGPVLSRRLARRRVFRYEVRRWRAGVIADADEAVASPQRLSDDPLLAHRLLELVDDLPSPVWGRDELGTGEMWNSNSVIAWLLARSGLPVDEVRPPAGGRAPGWEAGLVVSRRQQRSDRRGGRGARDADSAGRQLRVRAGGGAPSRWAGSGRTRRRPP